MQTLLTAILRLLARFVAWSLTRHQIHPKRNAQIAMAIPLQSSVRWQTGLSSCKVSPQTSDQEFILSHQILPSDFFAGGGEKTRCFFRRWETTNGFCWVSRSQILHQSSGALANPKVSNMGPLLQELNKLEQFESMPQWCLTTAPIVCTNFPWQFESAKVAKWVDSMPRTVERLPLNKTGWETASLFYGYDLFILFSVFFFKDMSILSLYRFIYA